VAHPISAARHADNLFAAHVERQDLKIAKDPTFVKIAMRWKIKQILCFFDFGGPSVPDATLIKADSSATRPGFSARTNDALRS
jgi:hypothetical protein